MPPHVYVHIVMYDDVRGVRGFSNRTAVVLKQLCQEKLCVSMQKQKHFIWPSESRCI